MLFVLSCAFCHTIEEGKCGKSSMGRQWGTKKKQYQGFKLSNLIIVIWSWLQLQYLLKSVS